MDPPFPRTITNPVTSGSRLDIRDNIENLLTLHSFVDTTRVERERVQSRENCNMSSLSYLSLVFRASKRILFPFGESCSISSSVNVDVRSVPFIDTSFLGLLPARSSLLRVKLTPLRASCVCSEEFGQKPFVMLSGFSSNCLERYITLTCA